MRIRKQVLISAINVCLVAAGCHKEVKSGSSAKDISFEQQKAQQLEMAELKNRNTELQERVAALNKDLADAKGAEDALLKTVNNALKDTSAGQPVEVFSKLTDAVPAALKGLVAYRDASYDIYIYHKAPYGNVDARRGAVQRVGQMKAMSDYPNNKNCPWRDSWDRAVGLVSTDSIPWDADPGWVFGDEGPHSIIVVQRP